MDCPRFAKCLFTYVNLLIFFAQIKKNKKVEEKAAQEFKCSVCNKEFTNWRNLKQHSAVHKDPSLICDTCGKMFKWRKSHRTHIKACQGAGVGGSVGADRGGGGAYLPPAHNSSLATLSHATLIAPLTVTSLETPPEKVSPTSLTFPTPPAHTQGQPPITLAPVLPACLGQPVYDTLNAYNMTTLQVSQSREYMTSPPMQPNVQCSPQTHN